VSGGRSRFWYLEFGVGGLRSFWDWEGTMSMKNEHYCFVVVCKNADTYMQIPQNLEHHPINSYMHYMPYCPLDPSCFLGIMLLERQLWALELWSSEQAP